MIVPPLVPLRGVVLSLLPVALMVPDACVTPCPVRETFDPPEASSPA